jgi:hypothetical protein
LRDLWYFLPFVLWNFAFDALTSYGWHLLVLQCPCPQAHTYALILSRIILFGEASYVLCQELKSICLRALSLSSYVVCLHPWGIWLRVLARSCLKGPRCSGLNRLVLAMVSPAVMDCIVTRLEHYFCCCDSVLWPGLIDLERIDVAFFWMPRVILFLVHLAQLTDIYWWQSTSIFWKCMCPMDCPQWVLARTTYAWDLDWRLSSLSIQRLVHYPLSFYPIVINWWYFAVLLAWLTVNLVIMVSNASEYWSSANKLGSLDCLSCGSAWIDRKSDLNCLACSADAMFDTSV